MRVSVDLNKKYIIVKRINFVSNQDPPGYETTALTLSHHACYFSYLILIISWLISLKVMGREIANLWINRNLNTIIEK